MGEQYRLIKADTRSLDCGSYGLGFRGLGHRAEKIPHCQNIMLYHTELLTYWGEGIRYGHSVWMMKAFKIGVNHVGSGTALSRQLQHVSPVPA